MVFKYYHGTSTIFLESIRKHGLGTINPNTDLKNLDVLRFLFDLSERHLNKNSEYITIRNSTWAMVNQGIIVLVDEHGNKLNTYYKHDGIYVAISRVRAAIYATLNKYGSEILEKCIILYQLLCKASKVVEIPSNIDLFNFRQYLDIETKPIMIEVLNVKDEELEKEDGKTAKESLDLLRTEIPNMTKKEEFEFLQYCNFKLLEPVPPERLKFFEIEYEGHPAFRNFEFVLSRI